MHWFLIGLDPYEASTTSQPSIDYRKRVGRSFLQEALLMKNRQSVDKQQHGLDQIPKGTASMRIAPLEESRRRNCSSQSMQESARLCAV